MEIVDERKNEGTDKLKALVKKVKGVKNIQIIVVIFIIAVVLIIYSSVIATKEVKSQDTSASNVMSDDEIRLSNILSKIDGAGNVQTMITTSGSDVVGVLIIADGATNPMVRIRLVDATATALGIDAKMISVFAKQG